MKLPTYESTMAPPSHLKVYEIMRLVLPYLIANDLVTVATLSKTLRAIATPLIWSNPGQIFQERYRSLQQLYDGWNRFLDSSSPSLSHLVKIIDCSKGVDDGSFDYSRFVRLDNGSSNTLSNAKVLAFPHHLNMDSFKDASLFFRQNPFSMKVHVFSAINVTGIVYADFILQSSAQTLLYLDLTGFSNRIEELVRLIPHTGFPNLSILKLAVLKAGLRPGQLAKILEHMRATPFSIDVTGNNLPDDGLRALQDYLPAELPPAFTEDDSPAYVRYFEQSPIHTKHRVWESSGERTGYDTRQDQLSETMPYRKDTLSSTINFLHRQGCLDNHPNQSISEFIAQASHDAISQQPIDDHHALNTILNARTGLTHLHISGNRFSDECLASLLFNRGIQHLDIGGSRLIEAKDYTGRHKGIHKHWQVHTNYGGITMIKNLNLSKFSRLHYLRIHHFLVTGVPSLHLHNLKSANIKANNRIEESERVFDPKNPNGLSNNDDYEFKSFDPHDLPSLHTLVLTDVPRKTAGKVTAGIIATLIKAAKQEEYIAEARKYSTARFGPPIFSGLRVLCLEFEAETVESNAGFGDRADGDVFDSDVRTFHDESVGDFSFFAADNDDGNEEREAKNDVRTLNETKMVDDVASINVNDKVQDMDINEKEDAEEKVEDLRDVVEEIKKFRKSVESTWTGRVQVEYMKQQTADFNVMGW